MASGFSRVTLVGVRQRVDAVLPSDEPIGLLLPDLLTLTADPMTDPPHARVLVTVDGAVLDAQSTLAGTGIADGAILRLVGQADAPPAPVVHDVADVTAEDLDTRSGRWGAGSRRWTATAALVVAVGVAGRFGPAAFGAAAGAIAAAAAVGLAAVGWLLARRRSAALGTALLLAGTALGLIAVWQSGVAGGWPVAARWLAGAAVVGAAAILLGAATSLGRGGVVGGLVIIGLVAVWGVGAALAASPADLAAVVAVLTALLLGVLPRYALSASGLAALDDRRSADREVTRRDVGDALAAAHRGLLIAVVAAAVSATVAGALLVAHPDAWTVTLAVLLGVVLLARSRTYPLTGEVVALLAAAGAVGFALLLAWVQAQPRAAAGAVAVAVGAGVVPVLVLTTEPPEHVRARLRRLVDWVEAAAVVATVPVAVGVFGTYGRLLNLY